MLYLLIALIIVACLILWAVVLIQNPKGGGLSSQFGGGVSNIIGAKKSVDFMERATWIMAISVLVLVLFTNFAIPTNSSNDPQASELQDQANETVVPAPADNQAAPLGGDQAAPSTDGQSSPEDLLNPEGE